MNVPWTVLLISALTDFIITSGTALTTAMVAADGTSLPTTAVQIVAGIGGLVAFARTIQQALRAGAETTAAVTKIPAPTV